MFLNRPASGQAVKWHCRGPAGRGMRVAWIMRCDLRQLIGHRRFAIACYAFENVRARETTGGAGLSDARRMGAARRDLAFVAAAGRDQFSGCVRSRLADVSANGGSASDLRAGLHQCLQRRARSGSARGAGRPAVRPAHLSSHSDKRTVVPRSRPDFFDARRRAAAGDRRLGLQRLGRQISAVRSG